MMRRIDYPRYAWPPAGAVVIADGNSLTAGANASGPSFYWPARAAGLAPLAGKGITPLNVAVSGQGISSTGSGSPGSTMVSRAAAQVDANLHATKMNVLTAWEFTNEVKYLAGDGAQAHANMRAYCLARKAAAAAAGKRLRIVVATAMPAYYSSQSQATVVAWNEGLKAANALMRDAYRSYADVLCDIAALPMFAAIFGAGTYTTAEFDATGVFSDRVHLTDASYLSVAAQSFARTLTRIRR